MDKQDYEYLKTTNIKNANYEQVTAIARILNSEYVFKDTDNLIYYFEKPWKWVSDIKELIKDYEQDLLSKTQCEDCKYFDGDMYCNLYDNADDLVMNCSERIS